jgi:hypothetical protein
MPRPAVVLPAPEGQFKQFGNGGDPRSATW